MVDHANDPNSGQSRKCAQWSASQSVLSVIIAMLMCAEALAATATWISGDGDYTTAANWDTDPVVPLNNVITYDVVINGNGTDVTFNLGAAGAVDSLTLGSGVRFITDMVSSNFTIGSTTANDATIRAEDQSTIDLGSGNLDRSNLIARKGFAGSGGALLTTSVTSWTGTTGFGLSRTFEAEGAGTLLDLSSLTTIERSGGNANSDINIRATDGGRIDLTGINGFTDSSSGTNGGINLIARDAGSEIDLANVTTISDVQIEVRDGGDITGQLTSITGRSRLLKRGLDDADGDGIDMIDLSQLTSANNATLIAEDGATLDLGSTSINQSDLRAVKGFAGSGGAQLTTSVTSWTGTTGFGLSRIFEADGAGTLLDLSSLTTIERSGGNANSDINIRATDGGRIDLTGINGFTDSSSGTNGGINLIARDAGSEIDLANVTTISDVQIEVRDGGDITGQLTSITGRSRLLKRGLDDADGDGIDMIDLSQLTSANNAMLIAEDGATLDLGNTSIDQSDLRALKGFAGSGGALLTTSVTSWTGTTGFGLSRTFEADGAGTLLDLSSLTTIERSGGNANSDINIRATDGGRIDFPDSRHEYQLVHGPSVCAMGMRVDDAQQAFERASLYGVLLREDRLKTKAVSPECG